MSSDNNEQEDLIGNVVNNDLSAGANNIIAAEGGQPTTEELEDELRVVSTQISTEPERFERTMQESRKRFERLAAELRRRRGVRDEQPTPKVLTVDQQRDEELENLRGQVSVLSNKIIAMETEQAHLVVEAELFKSQRADAEERLALVVKRLPQKREPISSDAATNLAFKFMTKVEGVGPKAIPTWVVDAVVEASR